MEFAIPYDTVRWRTGYGGGGGGVAIACESGSQDHMECFWQNSIFKHLAGILMEPVCNFKTATLCRGS